MALARVSISGDSSQGGTRTTFDTVWEGGFTPLAGDVAVVTGHVSGTNLTMSLPNGWEPLPTLTLPIDGSASRLYGWYKVLGAGEAAPTITNSGAVTGGWTAAVYRDAHPTTPIGTVATSSTTGTSLALGAVSGVVAGAILGAVVHARVASGTIPTGITPDADYVESADIQTSRPTGNANMAIEAAERAATAGGSYSGDTFTVTNSVSSSMVSVVYEVRPGVTDQALTASGIPSAQAFGSSSAAPGAVALAAAGIATALAFGAASVAPGAVGLAAQGITSGGAFGAASVTPGAAALAASGIPSGEAFGGGTATPGAAGLAASGMPSSEAFGTGSIAVGAANLSATGIPSGAAFGSGAVAPGAVALAGTGVPSAQAFGAHALAPGSAPLAASGIPSGEQFGSAVIGSGAVLNAASIPSAQAFGAGTVAPGAVGLAASGVPSAEQFGAATVAADAVPDLAATGIPSGEAFGTGAVTPGAVALGASSIPTGETFGLSFIFQGDQHQQLAATGIPSAQSFGRAVLARMAVEEQEMAPCLWDVDPGCNADWDAFPEEVRARAARWATEMLWMLSGRRFGTCPVVVRPCQGCAEQSWQTYGVLAQGTSGGSWVPFLMDGQWSNCGCAGVHVCHPDNEVYLPGPVAAISEVRINGQVVPADAYRVDDRAWLVRHDGGTWPRTQNLNRRPGAEDTFVITYLRGEPVPDAGKIAAGALAVEFARACTSAPCRLPQQAQSIIRQGVELQLVAEDAADMLTGVSEADQWLRAVNPGKLRQRPQVASLDVTTPRVTTWG